MLSLPMRQEQYVNLQKTAFEAAGIEVEFEGEGVNEIAKDKATGKVVLKGKSGFLQTGRSRTS